MKKEGLLLQVSAAYDGVRARMKGKGSPKPWLEAALKARKLVYFYWRISCCVLLLFHKLQGLDWGRGGRYAVGGDGAQVRGKGK